MLSGKSQSIKILGVTLDENLNFKDHLRSVYKKVAGMIGVFRRLKNLIPVKCQVTFVQISYHATSYLLSPSVTFLHGI